MIGGPRKSYSDVIIRAGEGLTERANTGTVGPSETSDARRAAFGLFCVERRINDGVVELTCACPLNGARKPEEGTTRWYGRRPKFVRSAWAWK